MNIFQTFRTTGLEEGMALLYIPATVDSHRTSPVDSWWIVHCFAEVSVLCIDSLSS